MAFAGTAPGRWQQLDGKRRGLLRRCEVYAGYTLPKICLPDDFHQNSEQMSHDFQAVGAQAVNHLSNKMMLALFAPSRPFFRLDATPKTKQAMAEVGAPEDEVARVLAQAEKEAVQQLDRRSLRPKLYEALKHLIITGNTLLCLEPENIRVMGIKKYVVRRSMSGKIVEIIIVDKVLVDELDPDVRKFAEEDSKFTEDRDVCLYRWIKLEADGDYHMTQWINQIKLPERFEGKWPEKDMPYRVLTWDLADGQDYGTGLVEDYAADFSGLSALSKSQIQGAILASEFRWLVNPSGMTKPEDLAATPNGGALPGVKDDIVLVESSKAVDLQVTISMASEYINRIGRAFLLGSLLVRDAERVTAEEIRMTANELETALGGGYSRIAVDFQSPLARWLLSGYDVGLDDDFEITVVTGLDALSRSGDLDELKLWLADMVAISNMPESLQAALHMDRIAQALAVPRRIDVSRLIKTPEERQAEQQAAMEQQAQMMAAQAGADVAANAQPPEGA